MSAAERTAPAARGVRATPGPAPPTPVLKRAFDMLVSATLLALLAPLLAWIAWRIRRDSPGPAIFRQTRVGRGGVPFEIHKFRTMREGAETVGPGVTAETDDRVTPFGRALRDRRLDELPQLWDVLRGAMSLVGPRPELPRFVAHYPEALRAKVLAVRPGLTDPASLAHVDEAALLRGEPDPEGAYVARILPGKLAQQAAYAERATLASDVAVLVRTLGVLLGRGRR